jgi:hypothetical protein
VSAVSRHLPRLNAALALWLCALATLSASAANATTGKATPAATLLGGVNIAGIGVGSQAAQIESDIAEARALHAKVVRTTVQWSALEPTEAGQLSVSALALADRLVSDASAAGIRVIMSVDSTPCWASSAPSAILSQCSPLRESEANAWTPANPATYGAFVAYLAARYGTQLAAIEVWNEPDQVNEAYLAGPNKPEHYAALLQAAYPAIKAVNPSIPVLAGSLVGSNGAFLRQLYAAGIKGYYDGLAVHFYNLTLGSVRSIHEVQLANGDTKPLWLDEFGWTSCWPQEAVQQEQGCVTEKTQALNLTNTFRELARSPYVAAAVSYKLQDSPHEDFGLLSSSGARKPGFTGLANALASPFGSVSPVTLSLRRKGARVLASGSGPVGDFMQLEVFRGKLLRYRTLFTLDRFNRFSIALPAVLGVRGLRVRVFQYWNGSAKATQKRI